MGSGGDPVFFPTTRHGQPTRDAWVASLCAIGSSWVACLSISTGHSRHLQTLRSFGFTTARLFIYNSKTKKLGAASRLKHGGFMCLTDPLDLLLKIGSARSPNGLSHSVHTMIPADVAEHQAKNEPKARTTEAVSQSRASEGQP